MEEPHTDNENTKLIRAYEDKDLAESYAKYRPSYPHIVHESIIGYLKKKHLINTQDGKFKQMLDVGCGSGTLSTQPFSPYFESILGVDISSAKIEEAKKLNKCKNVFFKVIDSYKYPIEDNTVDLITCGTSIHYLDIRLFEKECERILKPGGCCAFYIMNFGSIKEVTKPESDSKHLEVLLNPFIAEFMIDIDAHPCNFSALNRNRPIYDRIQNKTKELLEEIICETKMSLRQLKDIFGTFGDYITLMKQGKPNIDPLENFGNNIRKSLRLNDGNSDDYIILNVEMVYPIYLFAKLI
uniref:uncharacterized protein LOC120329983 n=1 Tax=Styela clava TaxID=7725 RepID=UPI001939A4CF|nr:uncharacterized protein LOC120329983 [Styela clava]